MQRRHFSLSNICVIALGLLILFSANAFAHGEKKQDKKGILLVAFGTTVPEAETAFKSIEKKVKVAFPDVEVRWAYSSKIVRHKLAQEKKRNIDSPAEALAKMMNDDFTQVAVQSLHTIPGEEYHNLLLTAKAFSGMPKGLRKITVGEPLLSSTKDVENAAKAVLAAIPKARKADEAVIFMGHGTHHPANIYYPGIQYYFWKDDPNVFVGTVDGGPLIDDVLAECAKRNIKKAYLMPLMAVAGDHAHNDMAGKDADSWVSALRKAGITPTPVMKGTGEIDAVVDIWVEHLKAAYSRLD